MTAKTRNSLPAFCYQPTTLRAKHKSTVATRMKKTSYY